MTDEVAAPAEGITDESTTEVEATTTTTEEVHESVDSNTSEPHQLLGGDDPMLKVPDKFLKDDGTPDYEKLTKSYNHLEKHKGPVSATPESADAYEISEDIINSNIGEYSEDTISAIKNEAFEMGMTSEQLNWMLEIHNNVLAEINPSPEQNEQVMKEAWGDNFEANINAAAEVLDTFGDALSQEEIVGNLGVIKLAAAIASEMNQDSPDITASTNLDEGEKEIDKLMADPAYLDKESDVRKRVDELLNKYYA